MMNLPASFHGCLVVAALQRAFPWHYLISLAAPPAITDASPFHLTCPPPSARCPTLSYLRGGAGNTDSGSDDNADDAATLLLTA